MPAHRRADAQAHVSTRQSQSRDELAAEEARRWVDELHRVDTDPHRGTT